MSSPASNIKPEFNYSPLKFNPLKAFNFTPLQVSRVSQLDSQLLDKELQNLLKDQFWQSFTLLKSTFKSKFEGEVSLILKSLCFYFSMIKNSATDPSKGSYGNKLQNLKFNFGSEDNKRESKSFINKKIVAFYLLSIGLPYILNKLLSYLQKNQWNFEENSIKQKLLLGLQKFQSFLKYASFLNYCAFLVDGKYLTLVGRVLRMRLIYDKKLSNRQISYEFLNRQLIWDAFSEFLMFLIPLINIQKLQTSFRKLVQSKSKSSSDNSTILSKLSSDKCAICYYEKYLNASSMDLGQGGNDQLNAKFLGDEDCTLQLAYQSNCGHLFCYACISTNLKQDSDYCCIVCDQRVTNIERYNEIQE